MGRNFGWPDRSQSLNVTEPRVVWRRLNPLRGWGPEAGARARSGGGQALRNAATTCNACRPSGGRVATGLHSWDDLIREGLADQGANEGSLSHTWPASRQLGRSGNSSVQARPCPPTWELCDSPCPRLERQLPQSPSPAPKSGSATTAQTTQAWLLFGNAAQPKRRSLGSDSYPPRAGWARARAC